MDGDSAGLEPASIDEFTDWDKLAKLTDPVTLEFARSAFRGWHVGQDHIWYWAAWKGPAEAADRLIRTIVVSRTPLGLVEQLYVQERLRAMPGQAFLLLDCINEAVSQ